MRRAQFFGNVSLIQKVGAWKVGGEWQHSGEREDYYIKTSTRTKLATYNVLNLTASYAVDKRLSVRLKADNVLNQDYMLAHGYSTLGRVLFVGITYQ